MKQLCRLFMLCTLLFTIVSVFPLAAESKEADVYYVHSQILKIFPHQKGYYVIYKRAGSGTGEVYIPLEWFSVKENKADISFINMRVNPYLSFFIRDGKCDYVRISTPKEKGSQIWGLLPSPQEYDEKFDGIDSLPLEF